MCAQLANVDLVVAGIAAEQHGVVSSAQLRAAGLTRDQVRHRVRIGRLHAMHRGVYAVGHRAPSWQKRWMAAVLACGEGAVLSHRSAAELWGLLRPRQVPVNVSTPSQSGRARRAGIRLHRSTTLVDGMVTRRNGIPVTTVARTVADLRGTIPNWLWCRAVRQAELAGYRLGDEVEADGTRSDLERDFLRLCRRHGLPRPEVNVRIGRWTVDFLWRPERLAVETDSYLYHRGRIAFQDDRARDLDLRRHGLRVRRFSEAQIDGEPERVAADLAAALADLAL